MHIIFIEKKKTSRWRVGARADKSGAIVIQDVKLHIRDAERQLNNTKNYKPLPNKPNKNKQ